MKDNIEKTSSIIKKGDKNGISNFVKNNQQNQQQNIKSAELNFVENKLENFQKSLLNDVNKRISGFVDEVLQEMRQYELQQNEFKHFFNKKNTWNNRISNGNNMDSTDSTVKEMNGNKTNKDHLTKSQRALPDKIFVLRESYLTALLEVDHMKAIYHIFYIILIVFALNSISYDYYMEERINFGLGTFKVGLNKIQYVLGIWLLEHVFVFLLYYAFKCWSLVHSKLNEQHSIRRFWSHSCLILYISSQLVFGYVASVLCIKLDLPFVSASVLLLESTRLLMKMHSFIRTNVGRVLAGKLKSDDNDNTTKNVVGNSNNRTLMPKFSQYLYFLFAPTLIYRDNYPRTSNIRWKFASARFLEVVAIAFLYSYIYERQIKVHFENIGLVECNHSCLIIKLFGMAMPSITIFLCGFYLILHSWLNFTSELLRFGDRMFYKDWWTACNYEHYFRNWNVVVHDWLYEYIYKDFYNHIFKGSKTASFLMVFAVSAYVHEHIMIFALQLFFPVLFIFFGAVSVPLVFLTRNVPKAFGNILLWFSLIIGSTLLLSLYSMEYYAQINCSKTYNTWTDYLTPAITNCNWN